MIGQGLLDREFLVLVPSLDGLQNGILESNLKIEVTGVTDDDGHRVLPAFTSELALLRWRPAGSPYIVIDGRTVLGLLLDPANKWDRMVVDTHSDEAFQVTRDQARTLLRQ
jgi:hypothetical protein